MGLLAMASIWEMFSKCKAGWLVYETQHLPIYIRLQAMVCKQGWLIYESGLSKELYFQTKISLAQT